MFRKLVVLTLPLIILAMCGVSWAQGLMPHAPAKYSWLPHGYGGTGENIQAMNTVSSRHKGLQGFRNSCTHVGTWSQPLWGWDVNGYYRGPQIPDRDPVDCQLPIGLIYPSNGPMMPPGPPVRKVSRRGK